MADISFINLLPRQIAKHYIRLKSDTSKIQRTTLSIAFIGKVYNVKLHQHWPKLKVSLLI